MSFKDKTYNTIVSQAKRNVVGFSVSYPKFIERVTIDQSGKSLITNYSRSIAAIALHFNRVPHEISVDEINSYLYRMAVHEKQSLSYFKQAAPKGSFNTRLNRTFAKSEAAFNRYMLAPVFLSVVFLLVLLSTTQFVNFRFYQFVVIFYLCFVLVSVLVNCFV